MTSAREALSQWNKLELNLIHQFYFSGRCPEDVGDIRSGEEHCPKDWHANCPEMKGEKERKEKLWAPCAAFCFCLGEGPDPEEFGQGWCSKRGAGIIPGCEEELD